MPVLRRHIVLLDLSGTAPHTGTAYSIVPSDADTIPDTQQSFVALVSLSRPLASPLPEIPGVPVPTPIPRAGPLPVSPTPTLTLPTPTLPTTPTPTPTPAPTAGAWSVVIEGSFDLSHWAPLGTTELAVGASALDTLVELGPLPTYVRARLVEATGASEFDWTAYVALGSTAAYTARAVA